MPIINNYPLNIPYGKDGAILLEEVFSESKKQRKGKFKCPHCGSEFIARISEMIKGVRKACGCQQGNRIHNYRNHPMYNTYTLIIRRCYNPNSKIYTHYGGRGILMSDEFKGNPKLFIDYISSLPNYDKRLDTAYNYSLDRIENNRGYERGNLRWADKKTQMSNRRRYVVNKSK